jgi:hypothetical protein
MAVRLSVLRTGRALLPRDISLFLVLISVRGSANSGNLKKNYSFFPKLPELEAQQTQVIWEKKNHLSRQVSNSLALTTVLTRATRFLC